MFFKKITLNHFIFLFLVCTIPVFGQQKITDFYLSNIKEDGSRDWEVEGTEAYIYDKHVDIDDMKSNYYTENDTIVITSDTARLDKENMDVFLEDNVNIVNEDGSTLQTESLDWYRSKNRIETTDLVTTKRDNMQITGTGLVADTEVKSADFTKDVEVLMPDKETGEVTTITCVGPLEIEYALGTAIFNDEVVVNHPRGNLFSDKATLFYKNEDKAIEKIVCEGNVKIIRDENVTFAQKATYYGASEKLILEGRPRIIYFTDKDSDSGGL